MMKLLIVLHRYLGVAVGLLMVLWCLSGLVMMYQGYPKLEGSDRLEGLPVLRLTPIQARGPIDLPDDASLTGFRLEMMAGRPVLHITRGAGRGQALDLLTGAPLNTLSAVQALQVARDFAAGAGVAGSAEDLGVIDVDQWTLDGGNRAGPIHHLRYDDREGTEIYVAAGAGDVMQRTTGRTRLLAWVGAVPHWLYPTVLRKNPQAWDAVVVWTSSIGVFLTGFGLYLGIARFKRYKSGRWSPYRGWFYWHHIIGLAFGVLTLTWVLSGLFTMGPWGLFDSDAGRAERSRLAGAITGAEAKAFVKLAPAILRNNTVQLEAAPFAGRLFVMATARGGGVTRLDSDGRPAPLSRAEVAAGLNTLGEPVAALDRLDGPDRYYYPGYDGGVSFPAYRATLKDPQATALYIDGVTGRIRRAVDAAGRQGRFWRVGLHDFDFAPLRARPLWDVVVLTLLAGVTGTCVTGLWLAIRRIGLDAAGLKARVSAWRVRRPI